MATFIKDSVRVYIARENAINASWSGISSLGVLGAAALGNGVTTRELMEVENVTGVSIGSFNLELGEPKIEKNVILSYFFELVSVFY